MKLAVPEVITRAVGKQVLKAKVNSPHILFVAGVAGVVTATVMACKATLNLEKQLDASRTNLHDVKQGKDLAEEQGTYVDKVYYRELTHVYATTALRLGRLYGPSIVVGSISIAALTKSHTELTKRNAGLAAALSAVTKSFNQYRERVREEVGEEREMEIYRNMEDVEVEENGKKKTVKQVGDTPFSPYSKLFDENNPNWKPGPDYNLFYIKGIQNYLNHRLQAYGHVMLFEAYDALNFDRTPECFVMGWLRDGGEGSDGFIDFGLDNPNAKTFMFGKESNIWLDFNVDDVPVYNKI